MRYDEYQLKMRKAADFIKLILRHTVKIVISIAIIMAVTAALLITKGMIIGADDCPEEIVYGDKLEYSANAFMSKVSYEYKSTDGGEWQTVFPTAPGSYLIRAAAKGSFGRTVYGNEEKFELLPKSVKLTVSDLSLVYGNTPGVRGDIKEGETVTVTDYTLFTPGSDSLTGTGDTEVIINKVKVTTENGDDVTECYRFTFEKKTIPLLKREIILSTPSEYFDYDGTPHTGSKYEITKGSFVAGHTVTDSYTVSITDAGSVKYGVDLTVKDQDGKDLTAFYDFTVNKGTLTVKPIKLVAVTPDYSDFYNGAEIRSDECNITEGNLVSGETASVDGVTVLRGTGSIKNELYLKIVKSDGTDSTNNYDIEYKHGTIEVKKRPITVTTEGASIIYDGVYHIFDSTEIGGQGICENESITIDLEQFIDAGSYENLPMIAINDSDGNSTYAHYEVTLIAGTVEIAKRKITVSSVSDSKIYDGEFLFNDGHSIEGDGIAEGQNYNIYFNSYVNADKYENSFSIDIADSNGIIVNENYEIETVFGSIEIAPRPITVVTSSEQRMYNGFEYAFYTDEYVDIIATDGVGGLCDIDKAFITEYAAIKQVGKIENKVLIDIECPYIEGSGLSNYKITYQYGEIEITPRPITVISDSFEIVYDGYGHSLPGISVAGEGIAPSESLTVIQYPTITSVGTVKNEIVFDILDEDGVSTVKNYAVTSEFGTLTVTHRSVTLITRDGEWIYDGTAHSLPEAELGGLGLADSHSIDPKVFAAITNVGTKSNEIEIEILDADGNPVTSNYDITEKIFGILEILKRQVFIVTDTASKIYDGTPLTSPDTYADEERGLPLAEGQSVVPVGIGSITDAGTCPNLFGDKVTILDAEGNDVTYNYQVDSEPGTLEVIKRAIILTSENGSHVYDGTAYKNESVTVGGEGIAKNQFFNATDFTEITFVSIADNEFKYVITDIYGESVAHNYDVTVVKGTLEVTKRDLTVTTPSHTLVYKGDYYYFDGYSAEGLAETDTVVTEGALALINVGTYENTLKYVIVHTSGRNVVDCYNLTEDFGQIEITPLTVKVTTSTESWLYDGETHFTSDEIIDTSELISGHTVKVAYRVYLLDATAEPVENALYLTVLDSLGEDVTGNYVFEESFGTVSIRQRKLTVYSASKTWLYDAEKHSLADFEIGEGDGLVKGHLINVSEAAIILNAGTKPNLHVYSIRTSDGFDVTENYSITPVSGTLTVTPRTLVLLTGSEVFIYDGNDHINSEIIFKGGDGLAYGETVKIKENTVIHNVGTKANALIIEVVKEIDGSSVNKDNYDISVSYGKLVVKAREIILRLGSSVWIYDDNEHYDRSYTSEGKYDIVEGHTLNLITPVIKYVGFIDNTAVSFSISDGAMRDVTANYTVSFINGRITVEPRPITVTTGSAEKVYDSEPLTSDEISISEDPGIVSGHTITVITTGSITNVGSAPNTVMEGGIVILDRSGNDVTVNYDVEVIEGILKVLPRRLIYVTGSCEKIYDSLPLICEDAKLSEDSPYAPVLGHTVLHSFTAEAKNVGTYNNTATATVIDAFGQDVTGNYEVEYVCGTLTVHKRPIILESASAGKLYDGTPLTDERIFVSDESPYPLCDGHTVEAVITGSITEVGTVSNTVEGLHIFENGEKVTDNYDITIIEGKLTVASHGTITVETDSATKYYDGTPLTVGTYRINVNSGDVEVFTSVKVIGTITMPGKVKNEVEIKVINAYGVDVTDFFVIDYRLGYLEILPIEITVDTDSESWVYDGEYHSNLGFTVTGGKLIGGHSLSVGADVPSIRNKGTLKNLLNFAITDRDGNDVTAGYSIKVNPGILEVTPAPLYLVTDSSSWIYDGKAHFMKSAMADKGTSLAKGDKLIILKYTEITDATEGVENLLEIAVYFGEENVTDCYEIEMEYGTLSIEKRHISITSESAVRKYNGKPLTNHALKIADLSMSKLVNGHVLSATFTGTITEPGTVPNSYDHDSVRIFDGATDVSGNYVIDEYLEGTLTVSVYGTVTVSTESAQKPYDGTPLTNPNYTVTEDLPEGYRTVVSVTGSITNIGSTKNVAIIKVYSDTGEDVTSLIAIKVNFGKLTVTGPDDSDGPPPRLDLSGQIFAPPPSTGDGGGGTPGLTITADYSGTAYMRIKSFGNYAGNKWLEATEYDKLILGTMPADRLAGLALLEGGYDKHTATVTSKTGEILIPYYTYSQNGYPDQSSDVLVKGVSYEYSFEFIDYDGTQARGKLPEGLVEFEKAYRQFVYANYLYVDEQTYEYMSSLIEGFGWFKDDPNIVQKVASYVSGAATYNLNYDSALNDESNIAIAFLETYKEGICQHYATAATLIFRAMGIPARYTVGYAPKVEKDKTMPITSDVAHAWVEVYLDGMGWIKVEVTGGGSSVPAPSPSPDNVKKPTIITLSPEYEHKMYDGEPLVPSGNIIYSSSLEELLAEGYTYQVKVEGSQTKIGRGVSTVTSFELFDPSGEKVYSSVDGTGKKNYTVKIGDGVLEVAAGIVEIYLYQIHKNYDGTAISYTPNDYFIISNPNGLTFLMYDINISFSEVKALTSSEINNNILDYLSYKLIDSDGNDVTDSVAVVVKDYASDEVYDVAKISKRILHVTTASDKKEYDRTPLTNNGYFITLGSLVKGHRLTVEIAGSITEVGVVENTAVSYSVVDGNGVDVSDYYEILFVNGKLEVTD